MNRRLSLFLALAIAASTNVSAPADWVAGRDMVAAELSANDTADPNAAVPAWSYGGKATLTSPLQLLSPGSHSNNLAGSPNLQGWAGPPTVDVNVGNQDVITNFGFGDNRPIQPGFMGLHPSSDGTYATVRFTAPAGGIYEYRSSWLDIDPHGGNGASAEVVLTPANPTPNFHQDFDNGGSASLGPTRASLHAGNTIDFMLGPRGDYTFDSTEFDASVSLVGDLTGDNRIDPDDFARIDRGYALHLTTAADGDLNHDGAIDAADYLLIDNSYLLQQGGAAPDWLLADRQSTFGPAYIAQLATTVPEPSAAIFTAALLAALKRKTSVTPRHAAN